MPRLGLTPDELLMRTWCADGAPRYAACLPGLNVLAGETLALVGTGTDALLDRVADCLDGCLRRDGGAAAATGSIRIHAVQAVRDGWRALALTEPFAGLDGAASALALADLAALGNLGLTTVVTVADVTHAALFSDRVVVVSDGHPEVAYPVLAPTPRRLVDVAPVTDRVAARLTVGM